MNRLNQEFHLPNSDLMAFQVVAKMNGVANYPLSPLFETVEQAREILTDIQENIPTARISRQTFFHNSVDDEDYQYILSQIVKADRVPCEVVTNDTHLMQTEQA